MTTTQKTTETNETTPAGNHRKVDVTSGRDRYMNAVKTAAGATATGFVISLMVAFAMGWNRDQYLKFVGFAAVVAFGVVVVKAYRTYVSPGRPPVVEETPVPEVEHTP